MGRGILKPKETIHFRDEKALVRKLERAAKRLLLFKLGAKREPNVSEFIRFAIRRTLNDLEMNGAEALGEEYDAVM